MASAAEKLAAWQKALNGLPIFMSVNLSSRQIIRRDLINDLRSILNKSNFIPGTFKLELTESAVMENPEQAVFILNKVKSLGVGLSLDDFGTGHSSLSYLSRFPFDIIKVDKSFVKDMNPKRDVLLRSIISMAHDLGSAGRHRGRLHRQGRQTAARAELRICAELHVRRAGERRNGAAAGEGAEPGEGLERSVSSSPSYFIASKGVCQCVVKRGRGWPVHSSVFSER